MADIRVRGRGVTEPIVTTTAYSDHVVLRVDCASNPEYWVEFIVPAGSLAELLGQCVVQRPEERKGLLAILDGIGNGQVG